jgi:hypothetical protein
MQITEPQSSTAGALNADVNMKINLENPETIEIVDNLDITEKFKDQVLIPYLSSLWTSLTMKSSDQTKGVYRPHFIEVTFFLIRTLVCESSWNNW